LLSDAPADRAMLTVRDTAAAARRLYDSTGWTEVGRWEPDLTIMGKPLR
jgi:hypothetical protein